jgi:hypothetical protein
MAAPALAVIAVAVVVPLMACDVSQQPRPVRLTVGAVPAGAPQSELSRDVTPRMDSRAPVDMFGRPTAGPEAGGERSIRLYGPGVSRSRQTRV